MFFHIIDSLTTIKGTLRSIIAKQLRLKHFDYISGGKDFSKNKIKPIKARSFGGN